MTPARLAAFARSPGGRLYGKVCERYGLDPAAGIADDVLAYNLRVALALETDREVVNDGG